MERGDEPPKKELSMSVLDTKNRVLSSLIIRRAIYREANN